MNKERLQFRAWNGKKMFYSNKDGNVLVLNSRGWELGDQDYDWEVYGASSYSKNIIMQCTGLRDKNNTLIWEGDILKKTEYYYNKYDMWSEEEYEEVNGIREIIDVCSLENMRYWLENETFGYEGEGLQYPERWEVIGNIYEHPEKLTK